MKTKSENIDQLISDFGIEVNDTGELIVGGSNSLELARIYGTPLHVVNEERLESTARDFLNIFHACYPGKISAHYAFKCNSVPGVLSMLKKSGLKAEVMSEFELKLASHLGFIGQEIIVNGPCKTDKLIKDCIEAGVRFIIIDSINELENISMLAMNAGREIKILLRINPDYVPKGMNQGSATGSRENCAFGLDMKGGEVLTAFERLKKLPNLSFHGFHFHIGSGISVPADYYNAILKLKPLVNLARSQGYRIDVIDTGGGFGVKTSREMTTFEMVLYQALSWLPYKIKAYAPAGFNEFAVAITYGLKELFAPDELPELIIEPGRCLASNSQMLLIKVHQVKERKGLNKWLITDGGIGTVNMPTYYEFHKVLLCNNLYRPLSERVTINGPGCFTADVVYKNIFMPEVYTNEILSIMDSGAYFISWESNFGYPRPAVVSTFHGSHNLIRERETFKDMILRDEIAIDKNSRFHSTREIFKG